MYILCMQSHDQMQKYAYELEYGSWYEGYHVEDMEATKEQLSHTKNIEYHFFYQMAYDKNNMTVGFGDEGFYDFCQVTLTDGRFPESDNEVVVSDEFSYEIGQHIYITISDQLQEMEIVGVVHNSQPIFCDIYVASQQHYDDAYFYSDTALLPGDAFSLSDENQYGYDHNPAWVGFYTNVSRVVVMIQASCLMGIGFDFIIDNTFEKTCQRICLIACHWHDH